MRIIDLWGGRPRAAQLMGQDPRRPILVPLRPDQRGATEGSRLSREAGHLSQPGTLARRQVKAGREREPPLVLRFVIKAKVPNRFL